MAIPTIDAIKRVILDVLDDGRERDSKELRTIVGTRFRLTKEELERRPATSRTPIFTNWHAWGLVRLQNNEDPELGQIVRTGVVRGNPTYRITRHGRAAARHMPLPPELLEGETAEAVAIVEILAGRRDGQGWRLSASERQAIERHAVTAATAHFEALGYTVKDVGAHESYDLQCTTTASELHVEVKGTTTGGSDVVLTPNEVAHARDNRDVALFIYSSIAINSDGGLPICTGGEGRVIHPWQIDKDGELRPVGYSYTLSADAPAMPGRAG